MSINGKMQKLSVDDTSTSKRPSGIPPSHPHYPPSGPFSQFGAPKMGSGPQNYGVGPQGGPTHSRSLSQSSFFSFDHLPPLSPSTFREASQNPGENRVSNDVIMEERASNSQGSSGVGVGVGVGVVGGGKVQLNEGLPPHKGHRRSNSDVTLGFGSMNGQPFASGEKPAKLVLKQEADWGGVGNAGNGGGEGERKMDGELVDDLFSAYMNLENIDALNSSSMEDKDMDSRASGTRTNESSENEVESSSGGYSQGFHGASSSTYSSEMRDRGKRSASGDIAPTSRHFRSISMDSFMGNLNFSDESPKLPPSPVIQSAQHSPTNSMDGNNCKIGLEIGSSDFSAAEMKKIMANDKLAELAMVDPKRVKRILANRQSAARSKERKVRYIVELEHKVQTLQTEATTLSAQLTLLQRDLVGLTNQNNELRLRLQAMEQQAHLRDALNEALTAEVQRLKLETGELRGEAVSSRLPQQFMSDNQMFQMMQSSQYMYQSQQRRLQVEQPKQSQGTKSEPDIDTAKS